MPFGSSAQQASITLRERILRIPLGLRYSAEELAAEAGQEHIGAYYGDQLLGTLLLVPMDSNLLKMRQVAVDTDWQGRGVGKQMVAYSEAWGKAHGYTSMVLHARETAVSFYLGLGYEVVDEPFTEVGIPHRRMRKQL